MCMCVCVCVCEYVCVSVLYRPNVQMIEMNSDLQIN